MCRMSVKYDLPFQIHTGHAHIDGSHPMNLVNVIKANPDTKFILFHGGFPWGSEVGGIAVCFENVWIDSCWLPILSYSMVKRAFREWLEIVPSDRIMWGGDEFDAEGIYGGAAVSRQCVAEVLAEMVLEQALREEDTHQIGRQSMRKNALKIFPKLSDKLWRGVALPKK